MRCFGRYTAAAAAAALLGTGVLSAGPAFADEQLETLRKGKEAFASQCLNCHPTIDEIAGEYRSKADWEKVVADMVGRGAKLDGPQQAAVVEYLGGRMLLVAKCRGCHTFIRPMTANKSLEGWRSTVERMAGKTKLRKELDITPEQIERLARFLSVERPPR